MSGDVRRLLAIGGPAEGKRFPVTAYARYVEVLAPSFSFVAWDGFSAREQEPPRKLDRYLVENITMTLGPKPFERAFLRHESMTPFKASCRFLELAFDPESAS